MRGIASSALMNTSTCDRHVSMSKLIDGAYSHEEEIK
jgi:hypothetical protein